MRNDSFPYFPSGQEAWPWEQVKTKYVFRIHTDEVALFQLLFLSASKCQRSCLGGKYCQTHKSNWLIMVLCVFFAETILIYHPAIWKSWKCAEDLFGQKSLGFIAELEPKVHFWAANKGTASICHKKKRRAPIGNHLFSTYWQHLSIRRRKPTRNSPWWC